MNEPDVEHGEKSLGSHAEEPFGELGTAVAVAVDAGLQQPAETKFDRARLAVAALRGRGRDLHGRATPGNTLRLTTGLRSVQLVEQPDIAAFHHEEVESITRDLGGASELTALKRAAVREAARLEVIMGALGGELLEGGVLTGKGKTRSAANVYLHVLDRFTRLAQLLGLERRSRHVDPLQRVRDAVIAANQPRTGEPS